MHVHINHMFCPRSNWTNDWYNSRYMVSIKEYLGYKSHAPVEQDWSLLEKFPFFDQELFERLCNTKKLKDVPVASHRHFATKETYRLKPEVFAWLKKNVKDVKDEKGFCVGNDKYNSNDSMEFNIFFKRRSDAMKFIKRWSSHKKPTTYFDYFSDVRKQLNFKTKTLQVVSEFTL